MTNEKNDELETPEIEEVVEEVKVQTPPIPKVTKIPVHNNFMKWGNQFRWNQNNFTKQVQRKASWRGR